MTIPKNCVFCTSTNRVIDFIPDDSDGAAAVIKFKPQYGDALIILPFDEAWSRYENQFKCEPVEITDERWHEMLGVLPPVAWKSDSNGESFKISERTAVRAGDPLPLGTQETGGGVNFAIFSRYASRVRRRRVAGGPTPYPAHAAAPVARLLTADGGRQRAGLRGRTAVVPSNEALQPTGACGA